MKKENRILTSLVAFFALIISLFSPMVGNVYAVGVPTPGFAVSDSVSGVVYGQTNSMVTSTTYGTVYAGIPLSGDPGYYAGIFTVDPASVSEMVYGIVNTTESVSNLTYSGSGEISGLEDPHKFLFMNPSKKDGNGLFEAVPILRADNGRYEEFGNDGTIYTATMNVVSGQKVDLRFMDKNNIVSNTVYATVYANVYDITTDGTLTVKFNYHNFANVLQKNIGSNGIEISFTAAQNQQNSNNNSNTGTSNSTTQNSSTETKPVVKESTTATEVSFPNDFIKNSELKGTKVELDLTTTSMTKTISVALPAAQVLELKNKNAQIVEVKLAEVTLQLPIEVLATSKDVKLDVKKADITSSDAKKLIGNATGNSTNFKPLNMFTFDLTSGGSKLGQFVKPITITVDAGDTSKINKTKAGMFYINGTAVQFVGGKWNGNKLSFKAKHFSDYAIMENTKTFNDITNSWSKENIEIMASRMITNGNNDKEFAPLLKVTRAEFAAFIVRALGIDTTDYKGVYSDVVKDKWYGAEVEAAAAAGIIKGTGNGNFTPEQNITREQMATMIMRAYEISSGNKIARLASNYTGTLKDLDKVSSYALDYVKAANSIGLINGMASGNFSSKTDAQRDQIAKMIVGLLKAIGEI